MRFAVVLLAALVAAPVLAGCLSDDEAGLAVQTRLEDALGLWREGAPLANVVVLGEWRDGGAEEADAWGDFLAVDRGPAVHILNVSDPEAITEVSVISGPFTAKDVKFSDDGQWLFIGDDAAASGTSGAGGLDLPAQAGGFYVYDVSDKENPQFASHLPVGPRRGPHMLAYHQTAGGEELVVGANADVSINRFDRETGTLTEIARYEADPLTAFNRGPNVVDAYYQGMAHDMFVMEDPIEGRTLMYVANWDAGLRIVDLSTPSQPVEIGAWNDFPDGHSGNLHTVSTEWIGDRRITVGAVEVGFDIVGGIPFALDQERSVVYVWDTTDPEAIQVLGEWENPDGTPPGQGGLAAAQVTGDEILSTHNLQLENGRVYMAHYGLGVWILDVSTPEAQAEPQVMAYYLEDGQNTWDVVVHHGVMWSSGVEGVIGLNFLLDRMGPGGVTSRA